MCLEDLKLGRGRFIRKPKQIRYASGLNGVILPEDATRVAVIISSATAGGVSKTTVRLFSGSDTTAIPFMVVKEDDPPIMLDIERHGALVTSSISGNAADLNAGAVYFVGVYTDVKAEPKAR